MLTKDIEEALNLLRDENLVWSADLEAIKLDLANLLLVCAAQEGIAQILARTVAKKILGWLPEEETLTTFSPEIERR